MSFDSIGATYYDLKQQQAQQFAHQVANQCAQAGEKNINVPQINRDLWDRRRVLLARQIEVQTNLDIVDSLIAALTA